MIPPRLRPILALNPLLGNGRQFPGACLLPGQPVDLKLIGISIGVTVAALAWAVSYFNKSQKSFADII